MNRLETYQTIDEIEEIKNKYKTLKNQYNAVIKQNKSLQKELRIKNNKLEQIRTTLAKIKEIAKQCLGKDFCTDCKYCEQCYVEIGKKSTYDVCKLILQKISEVPQ